MEKKPSAEARTIPMFPEAEPGRKDDNEKERYDLVDEYADEAFVRVLTFGARKYAPENWRKVPEAQRRYYAAARRHMAAYRRGETVDPEVGEHPLACAIVSLHFILALELERIRNANGR